MWDHPELDNNSKGYPVRPGQLVCALYRRTQTCKFGILCMYDHPEPGAKEVKDQPSELPTALAKAAAQQHQTQLLLHLQLLQDTDVLQDPDALMNAWVRFRMTFSLHG
uniref:C3H1-type domain-containing protein n=1 Tax=Spumella elongata TaxID=89044 RepID=A0A7S3HMI9_9STRA|mmetsp:Transcript_60339/g.106055  ORF Transcript_60339/g.106055 Transcript_60339/m.106055 type:complete len:108 (+) Transcript_60339:1-324(+)